MSEKKNPLDAAINSLKQTQYAQYGLWPNEHTVDEYGTAIRVLEAAGKVDIRSAQFFIDGAANFGEGLSVINSDSSRYLYQTGEKQIRALLETLPEKEEK